METNKWLDAVVDTAEKLRTLVENEKRYETFTTRREFQLPLTGLEHLAHDTGLTVAYNPNWCERHKDTGEAYIIYRGYKFLALWDKKGDTI